MSAKVTAAIAANRVGAKKKALSPIPEAEETGVSEPATKSARHSKEQSSPIKAAPTVVSAAPASPEKPKEYSAPVVEVKAPAASSSESNAVLVFDDEKLVSGPVFVTSKKVTTSHIMVNDEAAAKKTGPEELNKLLSHCVPTRSYYVVQLHKALRKTISGLDVFYDGMRLKSAFERAFLVKFAAFLFVLVHRPSKTSRGYDQLMIIARDQTGVDSSKLRTRTFDDSIHSEITIGDPNVKFLLRVNDKEAPLA